MRFKFSATVVVQLQGEAEVQGDTLNVFSEEHVKILPTFMTNSDHQDVGDDIANQDEETKKFIFQVLTNNVLARAHQSTRIAGVTVGVPVPAVIDTPPGERS